MNTTTSLNSTVTLPLRFLIGVVIAVVGGLLLFLAFLDPPLSDLRAMALFLTATALLSVAAVYLVYRLGWLHYSPRLSWTLLGGYGFASLLTFLNVFVTARLMFASDHDLRLAAVLLIFAGGIATALGYFLSTALSEKIQWVGRAAAAIAEGKRNVRVEVVGRDELAQLGHTFNRMVARLEEAERHQLETEQLRRNLLAWIGHDLRTPLASIQALVEALTDGIVTEPSKAQHYLRTVQRDAASLSSLIDELFEMAQIEAGGLHLDRQPISLSVPDLRYAGELRRTLRRTGDRPHRQRRPPCRPRLGRCRSYRPRTYQSGRQRSPPHAPWRLRIRYRPARGRRCARGCLRFRTGNFCREPVQDLRTILPRRAVAQPRQGRRLRPGPGHRQSSRRSPRRRNRRREPFRWRRTFLFCTSG